MYYQGKDIEQLNPVLKEEFGTELGDYNANKVIEIIAESESNKKKKPKKEKKDNKNKKDV